MRYQLWSNDSLSNGITERRFLIDSGKFFYDHRRVVRLSMNVQRSVVRLGIGHVFASRKFKEKVYTFLVFIYIEDSLSITVSSAV